MRIVVKSVCGWLALGALAVMSGAAAAEPATLNTSIVIRGDYVRVGDIFANAGDTADDVIARTPAPGKDVVLDAYWLSKVARKYDVEWQPVNRLDRALLRRDSRAVERVEIEKAIAHLLTERENLDGDFEVNLSTTHLSLHVPAESPNAVGIRDLAFDKRSGRFSAVIVTPPDSPQTVATQVAGGIYKVSDVPVLARRVAPDDIIRAEDIDWVRLRADRLHHNIVVEADNLIGKSPRRPLYPGRAIRAIDVERPVLVEKGSLVMMEIERPGMRLTAKGKAMDNGSRGDTVRISNLQSKTVVEAVVTGPGKVAVMPLDKVLLN